MTGDVSALRVLIPSYAGHDDAPARRLSDQQIRAWTGESLADLQDRIAVAAVQDRFDALLMRCEFGDQLVIRALEADACGEPEAAATVEAHDAGVIAAAARAKTVAQDGLDALIGDLERAFDERAAAVIALLKGQTNLR